MSVLELSVIMVVLLAVLGVSFVGVSAWKAGSDRAVCVLNIYHAQEAVRSYSNLHGRNAGETLAFNIEEELFGLGAYMPRRPECPAGGIYFSRGDTIPPYGELYLICSLAEEAGHRPNNIHEW